MTISQKRDYGDYAAVYKLEGNVLTAERKLTVSVRELPSSRVQDYLAFRRTVVADLAQPFLLETTSGGNQDASADMKPEDLHTKGWDAIKAGNYSLAIDLLKRSVVAEPRP